jgi:TolA-binding protein
VRPGRAAGALVLAALLAFVGCSRAVRAPAPGPAAARPAVEAPAPMASVEPRPAEDRIAAQMAMLEEQMMRMARDLGTIENAVANLVATSRHQDAQLQAIERRVSELNRQGTVTIVGPPGVPPGFAPSPQAPGQPAPPPAGAPRAEELYRAGLDKLERGELDAAALDLYELIAYHPDHQLREPAQFTIADILYRQKDFRGARAELEGLLAAVPKGRMTAEALLKLGLSARQLGDERAAREVWERLVQDHPKSTAAREARALLRHRRG